MFFHEHSTCLWQMSRRMADIAPQYLNSEILHCTALYYTARNCNCNIHDLILIKRDLYFPSSFHCAELIWKCFGVCHLKHGLHLVLCLYPNIEKWRQMNSDRGPITIAILNGHIKMITSYNQDIEATWQRERNALIISHISVLTRSKILTLRSGASQLLTSRQPPTICVWIHSRTMGRNPRWQR